MSFWPRLVEANNERRADRIDRRGDARGARRTAAVDRANRGRVERGSRSPRAFTFCTRGRRSR